jgi:hypothetical protein
MEITISQLLKFMKKNKSQKSDVDTVIYWKTEYKKSAGKNIIEISEPHLPLGIGKVVLPAVFLSEFNGEKETCIILDRTRTVNYNGNEIKANNYSCSSCKNEYIMEEQSHKYCPFCGINYKFKTDISV